MASEERFQLAIASSKLQIHSSTPLNYQLAEDLRDSILEHQNEHSNEIPLTDAQKRELDRRLDQYQQAPTAGSTRETVKQRLGLSR